MVLDVFESAHRSGAAFQALQRPDGDDNGDSDDNTQSELDILECVDQDLRQLEIDGPVIAELDSLERVVPDACTDSDGSFFDYDQLEEKSPTIRVLSRNGCIDDVNIPDHVEEERASSDVEDGPIPVLDWTEDEAEIATAPTSPCRRAERFRESRSL